MHRIPSPSLDLSQVGRLTTDKTQSVCSRGYRITGFVLTSEDGRKCLVDQSAVRWFEQPEAFGAVMHPQERPVQALQIAKKEGLSDAG